MDYDDDDDWMPFNLDGDDVAYVSMGVVTKMKSRKVKGVSFNVGNEIEQ